MLALEGFLLIPQTVLALEGFLLGLYRRVYGIRIFEAVPAHVLRLA